MQARRAIPVEPVRSPGRTSKISAAGTLSLAEGKRIEPKPDLSPTHFNLGDVNKMTDDSSIAAPSFLYREDLWRPLKVTTLSGPRGQRMHVAIHEQTLSFYAEGGLRRWTCRVADEEPQTYYALVQGDLIAPLNGTSAPIHGFNHQVVRRFSPDTVLDYLRFFCWAVWGPDGAFWVMNGPADLPLPPLRAELELLAPALQPALFERADEENRFYCAAWVGYANTLFSVNFRIDPSGMVEMLEDKPFASLSQWIPRPFTPLSDDLITRLFKRVDDPPSNRSTAANEAPAPQRIRVLDQIEPAATAEANEALKRYAPLLEPFPLAPIPDLPALARVLDAEFPWCATVTDWLLKQLAVGLHGDGAFHFPPLLLLGEPGVGKTAYMNRVAELSGVASRLLALAGQTDNRLFNGTARGWNTARPSLPIATISDSGIANPILLLDELDKAGGSDSNGRIHDSLLELLEPASARRHYDEYLCGHADLAHLSWVATANETAHLPRTLLGRFQVLRMEAPEPAHYPAIVRRTVAAFVARRGLHPAYVAPFDEAEWRWLARQFGSPRQAKRATELLLSHRLLRPSGPGAIH